MSRGKFKPVAFPCRVVSGDKLKVMNRVNPAEGGIAFRFECGNSRGGVTLDAEQIEELHRRLGDWLAGRRNCSPPKWADL